MSTSSILHNFVISDPEIVEQLLKDINDAYEGKIPKKPLPKLSDIMATDEEIEMILQKQREISRKRAEGQ
jgi:hypothetical protein